MKKLIYYTVSGNIEYAELLKLSIKSLIDKGNYKDDILIMCDNMIREKLNFNNQQIKYHIYNKVNPNRASGNKLRVYEYDILKYDSILYLDTDILIFEDINYLFEETEKSEKFIISTENNNSKLNNENHGGTLMNVYEKEKTKDISGINAGVFLFKNTIENINILKQTYDTYINGANHICYEQPYFNFVLFKNDKFDFSLQKYISHNGYNEIEKNKPIIHFCGGPGNHILKMQKMSKYK